MSLEEWYIKGVSLDKLGKYEQAIGAYEKCLEINPEHADIWILKGVSLNGTIECSSDIIGYPLPKAF